MVASPDVTVTIDLARVRANAAAVAAQTGVPLLAVVKADAYGLGAAAVAGALCDLGDRLGGFYVFDAAEAAGADLWGRTGRRTLAVHGASADPGDYRAVGVRPVVWDPARAAALRRADPVLSLDTGQQRFACPEAAADAVRVAGDCHEVMTHATRPDQAARLRQFADAWADRPVRHAAGSALLGCPAARLDAVRPGLALYRGAVRVTTPLVDVRESAGPAGYTGFCVPRFGVILAGYRTGLRPGPCRVDGRPSAVLEVGMQSAFVEVGPEARVGDPVVLLGWDGGSDAAADVVGMADAAGVTNLTSMTGMADTAGVAGTTKLAGMTDVRGEPNATVALVLVAPTCDAAVVAGPTIGVTEAAVAAAWRVSAQEVLVRLTAAGRRVYV